MRSDPSYLDLARPQLPVAGGSSHRLGNLRNALMGSRISNFAVFVTTTVMANVIATVIVSSIDILQNSVSGLRDMQTSVLA